MPGDSVMPWPCTIGTVLARHGSTSGRRMPVDPVYTVVRLERSAAAQRVWAARARVITGVAMKRVTRWRCRSASTRPGSNWRWIVTVAPAQRPGKVRLSSPAT